LQYQNSNTASSRGKGHQFLIALLLSLFVATGSFANRINLDSLSTRQVWLAAQLLPGSGQIINKQYWKAPFFYAGMGSMLYLGLQANDKYHKTRSQYDPLFYGADEKPRFEEKWTNYRMQRNFFYANAALFYVASVADALIVNSRGDHSPTTATVLSTIVPGLGQVYNQKLWKVPIVMGGIATLCYVVDFNQRGYKKFGNAYKNHPNDEYGGKRDKNELLFLRDGYRRNRDLSIMILAGFYVLNIIDANVDAHFFDWDISDNLALKVEPMFDGNAFSFSPNSTFQPTVGLRLQCNLK
jgi:hypothetical protein